MASSGMIWERFTPLSFSEITCPTTDISLIQNLANSIRKGSVFPNILMYGVPHSGKYTKVKCFLEAIYGPGIYNTTELTHIARQNCSTYMIRLLKSEFHYETSFTGLQYADRTVLSSLLDTYFTTMDVATQRHKILLIRNFEELTKPAQYTLRRRMETDYQAVRYIFISNN